MGTGAATVAAASPYAQADESVLFTPAARVLSLAAAVRWAERLPFEVILDLASAEPAEQGLLQVQLMEEAGVG